MDRGALTVFLIAAETGSLSEAGRRVGLSPTLASRRLASLEREFGVRPMHRTTRSVSLTADGETFLPHAQAMVEAEQLARESLSPVRNKVAGLLRVTAPAEFGRIFVAPVVTRLLRGHPELRVELILTDAVVDIVSAGIDVAVRISRPKDSSLVARKLADNPRVLCASPAYAARKGLPRALADLHDHECLMLGGEDGWTFQSGQQEHRHRVTGRLLSNSIETIWEACVDGLGLAVLSGWKVAPDLAGGRLVAVSLDDAVPQERAVWADYPSTRLVPARQRVFVEALAGALGAGPVG